MNILFNKRILLLAAALIFGGYAVWSGASLGWTQFSANLTYIVIAVFFLGMMVSSQQYEEDLVSKTERLISSFLFSYILFFRLFYVPLSNLLFKKLIKETFFGSDMLALFLFLIFFFLFGTAFLVLNSYTRIGFLGKWTFLNNAKVFFVLRFFFVAFLGAFLMLYVRNSFFSIKYSYYINNILPAATCGWSYVEYPNFIFSGHDISGENVCLYNFAKDREDSKYCSLILDESIKKECVRNISESLSEENKQN
jgi:hypothetical protein